ncbi:UNVERIFIED_CONTAM: hypothetical protein NCL1_16116 [Trichonephila clavipes]
MMVARLQLTCFFIFALALHKAQGVSRGSCREAQLCCTGRDGSCVVHPQSYNSIDSDDDQQNDHGRPCYCDHACLKVGDCCHDFQQVCGVTLIITKENNLKRFEIIIMLKDICNEITLDV